MVGAYLLLLCFPQPLFAHLYASFNLYLGTSSFGKGYAALPTANVFINDHDLAQDLVFRDAPANNVRSLSGVIARETTHLLIRKRLGYWRNLTMPAWKKEGYAEYVAGGSTLSHDGEASSGTRETERR